MTADIRGEVMTKLHFVKSAKKTRRRYGIRRGHSYYWWQFYRCDKQYSLTRPRRSQYMTRSPFLRAMMDLEDLLGNQTDPGEAVAVLEAAGGTLRELLGGLRESMENLYERFPGGCPTYELLENRVSAVEGIIEQVELAAERVGDAPDEGKQEYVEAILGQIEWGYE
jgi:hypothetical protein